MGNYTTPEEIDEMRELQQVTAVELLNGGKYRTQGETPPNRRKRGKNGMRREGGEAGDIRSKQKQPKAERVV